MKVLYIGDQPSRRNRDQSIAFEGTKSGDQLKLWFQELPGEPAVTNQSYSEARRLAETFSADKLPIIALGKAASKKLSEWGLNHFRLPHPSGLNRTLNDATFVSNCLANARTYILSFLAKEP